MIMTVGMPVSPIDEVAQVVTATGSRHGIVTDDNEREAAEERERTDRDRERGEPDPRDEHAVDDSAQDADRGAGQQDRHHAPMLVVPQDAITAADRPAVLATERSISPVMMISAIGIAINRIGTASISRKLTVVTEPKYGTKEAAKMTITRTA